jgi:hypothetical protein
MSAALQLAHLIEPVNRNFDGKRLTGAVFLDAIKALDTLWVKGILYKLTILNFSSHRVKAVSHLTCGTPPTSFQSVTSTRHILHAGVAQVDLSPLCCSFCV